MSRKSAYEEALKKITSVVEPGSNKGVQFEKPRSAQDSWKRSPFSADRSRTLRTTQPTRSEPRHGHFEKSVPITMLPRFKMRQYPAETTVLAVFKQKTGVCHRLSGTTFWNLAVSRWFSISVTLLSNKDDQPDISFTINGVTCLRKMAWPRGAYPRAKEQKDRVEDKDFFLGESMLMYQHGLRAAFSAKRATEVQRCSFALQNDLRLSLRLRGIVFTHRITRTATARASLKIFCCSYSIHLKARRRGRERRSRRS